MKRILFVCVVLALALTQIAAAAPDSTTVAVNIATVVLTIVTPFLPLAHFHLDGRRMVAVSMVVALVIALGAGIITGDLTSKDLGSDAAHLFLKFGLIWGGMQAVFQLFKDSPTVGPLLTTKPLLVSAVVATPKA